MFFLKLFKNVQRQNHRSMKSLICYVDIKFETLQFFFQRTIDFCNTACNDGIKQICIGATIIQKFEKQSLRKEQIKNMLRLQTDKK